MSLSHEASEAKAKAVGGVNPSTSPERHRFHFLDALRGIAAILVVLRHAPPAFAHALNAHNSYFAVDFFFCLSGFVIAFSYERRLESFMSLSSFTMSRVIRLWPIALLGIFLGAVEVVMSRYIPGYASRYVSAWVLLAQIFAGVLLLPYVELSHPYRPTFPLDGVMWTLSVEVLANIVYAVLVRRRLAASWILSLIVFVSFVLLVQDRRFNGTLDQGYRAIEIPVALARVGFSFFLGVLIYRLVKYLDQEKLYGKRAFRAASLIVAVLLACLCDPLQRTYKTAGDLLIVVVILPVLVFFGSRVALSPRWTTACAFLGTISYPIYILHQPLLWLLSRDKYADYASQHQPAAVCIMLAFLVFLVVMSWAYAKYYDTPVRSMLTARYRAYVQQVLV